MHKPYSGSILSEASWLETSFSEQSPILLVVTRQAHEGSMHPGCLLQPPALSSPNGWADGITSAWIRQGGFTDRARPHHDVEQTELNSSRPRAMASTFFGHLKLLAVGDTQTSGHWVFHETIFTFEVPSPNDTVCSAGKNPCCSDFL